MPRRRCRDRDGRPFGVAALPGRARQRRAFAGLAAATLCAALAPPAPAQTLLQRGEAPPPTYQTQLPPPATLRYDVRYKFLRGTGEIRWQPSGASYTLSLTASYAGLTLIEQTSRGLIDAHGLAPTRFIDRRVRHSPETVDFHRDTSTVTASGSPLTAPLPAGAQDGLSWMIQLAAIAAAAPERVAAGKTVSMAVVGKRGKADVWTLRSLGIQEIKTPAGRTRAVKLVREAREPDDNSAEIWLDPDHGHLPARATLGNAAGVPEFVLSLESVEPGR